MSNAKWHDNAIVQALLYRWAGARHRERLHQRVPCVVIVLVLRVTCIAPIFCVFHVFIRRHTMYSYGGTHHAPI